MLSQHRQAHHHEFNEGLMAKNSMNGHEERWKSSDRIHSSFMPKHISSGTYLSHSSSVPYNPDLTQGPTFDVYLLAIIRIDDKRNAFYSAEVVSKLRQKEQTHSFINKPCSLIIAKGRLLILDRATKTIAEAIPLENVDPTCVHADVPDTLNDIFMYRLLDRESGTIASQGINPSNNDSSSVVVFKCSNNEARILVDSIRNATGKPLKNTKSGHMELYNVNERHIVNNYVGEVEPTIIQPMRPESPPINNPPYIKNNPQIRTLTQQSTTIAATDYYKRLTAELNKCFDDIELFVRYLEAVMEYTKELEREHRRKNKKSMGLKQMVEKLPDDNFFIDILQKFKHSFNLLGELKHIIHNPNAPELVHYLISPLQFIIYTLRTKHINQLRIAQDIWVPGLTREAKELLLNCLTSKEQEVLHGLGPAWIRTADDSKPKFSDYRPVFFEGRAPWIQDTSGVTFHSTVSPLARTTDQNRVIHPFTKFDERQKLVSASSYPSNLNNNIVSSVNYTTTMNQQPIAMGGQYDASSVNRSAKNVILENYNSHMQNEHAWAIDRKRAGAKICAVKTDRKGQNDKELTVRRGELIEIEDSSRQWWRARNFRGDIGHVPYNIVEEIEIEQRPLKISPSIPSGINSHQSLKTTSSRSRYN